MGNAMIAPDPPARAGRPRSERARIAILEATADLLHEGGFGAATIEAVAARAEVSKVTIYKWWPTRGALAVDAYFHRHRQTIVFTETGDLAEDLRLQMVKLIRTFRGRAGAVMAELIGQAQADPVLAETLRARWIAPRREVTGALLGRAVERGELAADTDVHAAMDQLYAPLYYRLVIRHEPLTEKLAPILIDNLLAGIRRSPK